MISARPTLYAGTKMRSRLEARFAQFLDAHEQEWRYEPQCFASAAGQYLPDFATRTLEGRFESFIEIKPWVDFIDYDEVIQRMHIIRASIPKADLIVCSWSDAKGWFWVRSCLDLVGCAWSGCTLPHHPSEF